MLRLSSILVLLLLIIRMVPAQTIADSFSQAGENKEELQKVLDHYEKLNDTLKYHAAVFLIENMSIHQSKNYRWVDQKNNVVPFSELDFNDFDDALHAFSLLKDSVQIQPEKYQTFDTKVVTSDFLVRNIDMAFRDWQSSPWAQSYSWEAFLEYVLPYRSTVEPLEDWREEHRFLVKDAVYQLEDETDPVELCTHILYQLVDFSFVTNRSDPILILSPQTILFRRQGSCPDLTNLSVLAARSLGVAVTFDFTPHYGASSNRHFWNTVVDKEGNHIPFNSNAVANKNDFLPYIYNANRKRLGKVFRKTYSIQPDAIATVFPASRIPDGALREQNLLDVTQEYVPVSNLEVNAKKEDPSPLAFINVYNRGRWRPVAGAPHQNGKYVFKNMGRDIVYLAGTYADHKIIPFGYPILIAKDGNQQILSPETEKVRSVTLSRSNEHKRDYIDFNTLEIEDGLQYLLQYWDHRWKNVGIATSKGRQVSFSNVPENALFRLLPRDIDGFERIFTIDPISEKIDWY